MQITDIYRYWQKIENNRLGRWLFNFIIPFINPYTGALKAKVTALRPGFACIKLKDRRAIRNHLNSIHAIALTNLGEFTSGLALISLFTGNMRGIPIEIKVSFLKKARGMLVAECLTQLPDVIDGVEHTVMVNIKDIDNIIVAHVTVIWKLGFYE
ncbi:hypothetical protein MNBD_GAMMA07-1196 [hydrothermal vent metagenome]|uniref:DUF4442 domain-containing protein n=1 Tax=hydrothermal vent metagenome TaxID=652676 RepID=A0A3B0WFZ3_9ZZZZ